MQYISDLKSDTLNKAKRGLFIMTKTELKNRIKVTAKEFQDRFDELLDKAEAGSEVEITDYKVVLISWKKYQRYQEEISKIKHDIAKSKSDLKSDENDSAKE